MKLPILIFLLCAVFIGCQKLEYNSYQQFSFNSSGKYKWVYSRVDKPWNNDLEFSQDTTLTPNNTNMEVGLEFNEQIYGHVSAIVRVNDEIVKSYNFVQFEGRDLTGTGETIIHELRIFEEDTSNHWSFCMSSAVTVSNTHFNMDFPYKWTPDFHVYNFYEKIEE